MYCGSRAYQGYRGNWRYRSTGALGRIKGTRGTGYLVLLQLLHHAQLIQVKVRAKLDFSTSTSGFSMRAYFLYQSKTLAQSSVPDLTD